ncbi:Kinesin-like protein [Aphelenchoides fujianensis]|nr:Kinesin-like protein [Aphelenchoides fujianensis]
MDGPAAKKSKTKAETLEVVCRIKPYDGPEPCVEMVGDDQLRLVAPPGNSRADPGAEKLYKFAHVFEGYETQRAVFERCGYDFVENLIGGTNSLLFTYGVTGSGKTYTMTGDARDDSSGIIPRSVDVLFNSIKNQTAKCVFKPNRFNGFDVQSEDEAAADRARLPPSTYEVYDRMMETKKVFGFSSEMACSVFVSYMQIYNNDCIDLLGDDASPRRMRTDARGVNYVDGLTQVEVATSEEAIEQHLRALGKRKQASTMVNATSSRSHIVFNLRLVMAPLRDDGVMYPVADSSQVVVTQLSLVDLAGSERTKRTENRGERLVESGKINQSLSVLRKCFDQLRENQRRGAKNMVAYRENKLTELFKSYFEGHGKIRMIICVNPRPEDYGENTFVLSFGEDAQTVGVPEVAPAPMLCGLTNQRYPRRKVNQWYRQVEADLDSASLHNSMISMPEPPTVQLNGPDDEENLLLLREFYSTAERTRQANQVAHETSAANFEMLLMERLCAADLDHERIAELEDENNELRSFNSEVHRDLLRFQRENNKLRAKLSRFESRAENSARRDELQRRQWEQQALVLGEQREALRQVADALNDPSTTPVAELRKKFSEAAKEATAAEASGSRQGPTTHSVVREVHTRRVREYVGNQQGFAYNPPGYVNPRFYRRSRSAGCGGRVLNHEPVVRIPNGAVFQQQFPKNAKHTTQPNANDFRKCTDYIVTNQDVDTSGRLQTECIKGEIVPTAGGGHAVMFKDIERLTQESP